MGSEDPKAVALNSSETMRRPGPDEEDTSHSASEPSLQNAIAPRDDSRDKLSASSPPTNPRLQALLAKKTNLEATLESLQAQRSDLVAQALLSSNIEISADCSEEDRAKAALASANVVIKNHIALLQKYNEVKDIGQGLMGLIAEERNVRVGTVMEEFGMSEKD